MYASLITVRLLLLSLGIRGGVKDAGDDEEHAVRDPGPGPTVRGDGPASSGGLQQQRPAPPGADAAQDRLRGELCVCVCVCCACVHVHISQRIMVVSWFAHLL